MSLLRVLQSRCRAVASSALSWRLSTLRRSQGAGDNSMAVGMGLLSDYVVGTPRGLSGSKEDFWIFQVRQRGRGWGSFSWVGVLAGIGVEGWLTSRP